MSPKFRESIGMNQPNFGKRIRSIILTGGALVSALVVVAGAMNPLLKPVAKAVIVSTLDSTFVLQQSYARKTLTDSLTHKQEVDSLFRMVKSVSESQQRLEALTAKCLARATRDCR